MQVNRIQYDIRNSQTSRFFLLIFMVVFAKIKVIF